jgi:Flp pilus assembly protein TadD
VRRSLSTALLGLALLAVPVTASAEWRRAESEHFVVYGRSERSVREYASMLEDFDALLRRLHGRPKDETTPIKLPVYLVSDIEQLRRAIPSARDNTAGMYVTAPTEAFAIAVRDGGGYENDPNRGDDTVLHEYVHHFMLRYYPSAYPAWLVEGYAEYYMTVDLGRERMVVGGYNKGRAYSLTAPGMTWVPMGDLLSKRPGELGKWDTFSYYAQAWLLTHYILSEPERRKKLGPYLDAVRSGQKPPEAWQAIYGDDMEGLRKKLQAYMTHPLAAGALSRTTPIEASMTVTSLPASADALLLEGQRLKLGVPKDDRPKALQAIRTAAARWPDDRFARLVRAQAETQFGDRAVGEGILNGLLTSDPKDKEVLVVLGESRLMAAEGDEANRKAILGEAGKLFARAFKIDPDDPRVLHGYAEAKQLEPLNENMVNIRLRAMLLAPQVGHLRLDAGRVLVQTKDYENARIVLRPLAGSPHGGGEAEAALAMLKALPPEPATEKTATKPTVGNGEGDKKS